jgi:hypothetical protein
MATMTPVQTRRLLVTRRNPDTESYEAIGELSHEESGDYVFTYRDGVTRALPGMADTSGSYTSTELFPLFEHRVISPRRNDHDEYLAGLALVPDATPFEVLARSGGRSAVDTLELTPMPEPGLIDLRFLVHGIRHLTDAERAGLDGLSAGQALYLRAEPDNVKDTHAVLVTNQEQRLGYVPRPLLPYIHQVMAEPHELCVERVNPASAGFHMRLLVRLRGSLPS